MKMRFLTQWKDLVTKKGKLSLTQAHELFNDFAERAEDMMEASINDARSKDGQ